MNRWKSLPVLALFVLASCSGGGSSGGGLSPGSTSVAPSASRAVATGTLTIQPNGSTTAAGASRRPAYISIGTSWATLFIDGATTGERQNCGLTFACTFIWNSTAGPHTFSVETDDSPQVGSGAGTGGTILSEGQQGYVLSPGDNGSLAAITLEGVIGEIRFEQQTLLTPCVAGATFSCFNGEYGIADAAGNIITPPGAFTMQWIIGVTSPVGYSLQEQLNVSPDGIGTDYPFSFSCLEGDGTFTAQTAAGPGSQNPFISTAELNTYSLVVPTTPVLTEWPEYQCTNGILSGVGQANGSVTVQGAKR